MWVQLIYTGYMPTIHVRTDEKLKKEAMKVLQDLGLDLSTAVNMFLVQVKLRKAIPFEVRTENGFTPAQEEAILKELAAAKKRGKKYSSTKAMFKDILGK
jgi:DNA-damage-inducible protein J